MNDLIDQMFGDRYITLQCKGGECLHYSQVPGYVVCLALLFALCTILNSIVQQPDKPDNTLWVALSVASALFVVLLAFLGTFSTIDICELELSVLQSFGMRAEQAREGILGKSDCLKARWPN